MTRVRASLVSLMLCLLFAAGCGVASYEHRLTEQIEDLKYKQKLDTNLIAAPTDPYKTLQIYVRPPKPMTKMPSFVPPTTAGLWDLAETYSGSPPAEKDAASSSPMRLHILGRIKKKPATPKKDAAKDATKEEATPEPEVARAKFVDDVRALLGNEYGADAQAGAKADSKKKNRFSRIDMTSASSGNSVKAYLLEDKATGTEVALVFDIPQSINKTKMVTSAIDLCLESLGVGRDANVLFGGGTVSEGGGVKGGAAEGPAF